MAAALMNKREQAKLPSLKEPSFPKPNGSREAIQYGPSREDSSLPATQWSSSDYDDNWMQDLPSPSALINGTTDNPSYDDPTLEEMLGYDDPLLSASLNPASPSLRIQNELSHEFGEVSPCNYLNEPPKYGTSPSFNQPERNERENASLPTKVARADSTDMLNVSHETKVRPHRQMVQENSLKRHPTSDIVPPAPKRRLYESGQIEPSIRHVATPVATETKCRKPFPFKDMTGIDLDLLAQFEDIVDFIDTE